MAPLATKKTSRGLDVKSWAGGEVEVKPQPPPEPLCRFSGRILIVGFGSIGAGILPLLLRHIADRTQITILTAPCRGSEALAAASAHGLAGCIICALTPENYAAQLSPLLSKGDFLINASVDVSSVAMVAWCYAAGVMYQDTVVEPWAGGYLDASIPLEGRTNYAMREEMLALRRALPPGGPTCLVTHGANPGLVSHLVKQALLDIAAACAPAAAPMGAAADGAFETDGALEAAPAEEPQSREEWAALARRLGVKVIHISERDTQVCAEPKRPNEFVNTWSVDGFVSEGCQPAELGWGTHEKGLPADGAEHSRGERAAIFLRRPGCQTLVRTWAPRAGPFHGFLITHNESISIADYLTLRAPAAAAPAGAAAPGAGGAGSGGEAGEVLYRPTVHYAYHPCDAAVASLHELAGRNFVQQEKKRLIVSEVTDGSDELGVLLGGAAPGAYWLGSDLSAKRAKELAPDNSATTLQVTATMLGGVVFAIEHPSEGILEPEEMGDWRRVLEIAGPYIGPLVGAFSDWTPLTGRGEGGLFPAAVDRKEPWRFENVRVQ